MNRGTRKIIFFRNFFLRAFVVGILFALFYWIVTLTLWHAYVPWLIERFKLDEKELGALTLNFFANVRIVMSFSSWSRRWLCTGARRKPDSLQLQATDTVATTEDSLADANNARVVRPC